ALRPFSFQATARPLQAEPISAVGTYRSASVSPSQPDRPQPRGRPELAGKPCFPTEVKIFGISQNTGETLPKFRQKSKGSIRGPVDLQEEPSKGHRNMRDPLPSHSNPPHHHVRGDSAEISAEV
ncbi:hypothetical protein Prudu_232S000500, partial [Prunus dulcis]